jgi:hypothetical protein
VAVRTAARLPAKQTGTRYDDKSVNQDPVLFP